MFKVYVLSSVGGGPNFSEGVQIFQRESIFFRGSPYFAVKKVPGVLIGASLSEPHTSGTEVRRCVCIRPTVDNRVEGSFYSIIYGPTDRAALAAIYRKF